MMYYSGFSYIEAYNLPVSYKQWFMNRIQKEIQPAEDDDTTPSRSIGHNTPEVREMMGRTRTHVPANQRRFT